MGFLPSSHGWYGLERPSWNLFDQASWAHGPPTNDYPLPEKKTVRPWKSPMKILVNTIKVNQFSMYQPMDLCVTFPIPPPNAAELSRTQYIVSHWANGSSWTFGHHDCISLELLSGVHKGTNKMYLIRVLQSDLVWISGLKWPPTGESKDDFEEAVNIYSIYVYTGTVYKCIFIYYMHEILNKHFPWKR